MCPGLLHGAIFRTRHLRPRLLYVVMLLLSLPLSGQEICDNGRDDDGDGLVDLNDVADCACRIPATLPSLLSNPSFERYDSSLPDCSSPRADGLPTRFSQIQCVQGWRNSNEGSAEAFNIQTFYSSDFVKLPTPPGYIPGGLGLAGFTAEATFADPNDYEEYREYLTACLAGGEVMRAGQEYELTFALGYGERLDFNVGLGNQSIFSLPGARLAVYGVRDCGRDRYSGRACPEAANVAEYVLLREFTVNGRPGEWEEASVTLRPRENFSGLAIGGVCNPSTGVSVELDGLVYYFIDELRLRATDRPRPFTTGPVRVYGTLDCSNELIFQAPRLADATYQWYLDGVAIPEATQERFRPNEIGVYVVRITLDRGCSISDPLNLVRSAADRFDLPDTVRACRPTNLAPGEPFLATRLPRREGVRYVYPGGSDTGGNLMVTEEGRQDVVVVTDCGTYVHSIQVLINEGPAYSVVVMPEICDNRPSTITVALDNAENYDFTWRNAKDEVLPAEAEGAYLQYPRHLLRNVGRPNGRAVHDTTRRRGYQETRR